jgi:arsenite/tail-anchored protein-transporting ATPase
VIAPVSRFVFYAGKGGVGKTTCAAAAAVALASRGSRVLAISTDPAHSLGDVLDVRLSTLPRRVGLPRAAGVSRSGALYAAEIDARRVFARWIAANGQSLGDIVEHGTWLDREDVNALLGLSIPGIDELMGLIEIVRLAESTPSPRAYDVVVVDTAPTGHTLRLLAAPETVAALAEALDALQEEHRLIRDQLARVGGPDAADRLIERLEHQARATAALVRDRARATFHWVTLPEDLALSETENGIRTIERSGLRVRGIVINRAIPAGPRCAICDRRRVAERGVIDRVRRRLGRRRFLQMIPAELAEPRGARALARIGLRLTPLVTKAGVDPQWDWKVPGTRPRAAAAAFSLTDRAPTSAPESLDVFRAVRLLFFGGKGGVGKSTVAAAVALRLARAEPGRRVLLISTDPAHSLGHVFDRAIGNVPATIRGGPPNLYVREVDAAAAFASRRAGLEAALNEIGAAFGAGELGIVTGGQGFAGLMELAPPGIDELFGLLSVVEAREEYPLVVMDTAPTGHALRLLEMPEAAREWVQVILRVLLKYKSLVKPGQLAAELVDLSKLIRELQALLQNPGDARFMVVTRAAVIPRLETARLVAQLRRLRLSTPAVIVNAMTLAPGDCPRCRTTKAAEQRELAVLGRRLRARTRCAIIQTPLAAPTPRGPTALERWAQSWIVPGHR